MINKNYRQKKLLAQYQGLVNQFRRASWFVLCIFVSFIISACQSRLDIAGQDHKLVAAKWYGLAKYADSAITQFGITVTAELAIENVENKQIFKLHEFHISRQENFRNINLLSPNFEQKYLCIPQCFQLLEYDNQSGKNGATLLSEYFATHEFELFQFYGDLVLLAELLDKISAQNGQLFEAYLHSLANRKQSFDSTRSFIDFLYGALTQSSIDEFEANPTEAYADFMSSFNLSPDQQWSQNSDLANIPTMQDNIELVETEPFLPPEIVWGQSLTKPSEINWDDSENWVAEEAVWLDERTLARINKNVISASEQVMSWADAKGLPIVVGQNVCSYDNNLFGTVASITVDSIEVKLMGQAKNVTDGLIADFNSGALFEFHRELHFMPLAGSQMIPLNDLAICYLQ